MLQSHDARLRAHAVPDESKRTGAALVGSRLMCVAAVTVMVGRQIGYPSSRLEGEGGRAQYDVDDADGEYDDCTAARSSC